MRGRDSRNSFSFSLFAGIAGYFLGLLIIGGLLVQFVVPNPPPIVEKLAHQYLSTPEPLDSTSTPHATNTLTPSPLPSFTPTQSGPQSLSQRLIENYADVEQAMTHMSKKQYAEAILAWDRVIAAVPEYTEAYYQRGLCYLQLNEDQRSLDQFLSNAEQAVADFTSAIEIGPPRGDFYYQRIMALQDTISSTEFWAENQAIDNQIFADDIEAFMLGNSYPWMTRSLGMGMKSVGYCAEALEYFLTLAEVRGEFATPSGTINDQISYAYFCLGDYEQALEYNQEALRIWVDAGANGKDQLIREVSILHALGRYEEALEIINDLLEASPRYGGDRYYLRAIIYIELGEYDLAREDLSYGATQTWGRYGLKSYAEGLLALKEGNQQEALQLFQDAEATLCITCYSFMHDQALAYIRQLGGEVIRPTPEITPYPLPTKLPVVSDQVYFTPTPPAVITKQINLANFTGSGIIYLRSGEARIFFFRPYGYYSLSQISSLTVQVTGDNPTQIQNTQLTLMALDGTGFKNPIALDVGEFQIEQPGLYVSNAGNFFLSVENTSRSPVVIENIAFQLKGIDENGDLVELGYETN